MKILVVGEGGREHAIAWKLSQGSNITELFVAPGNAGTSQLATNVPISANDIDGLREFAQSSSIDLTVVGPEAPLAAGIADRFLRDGLAIFGPTQGAARIESSKVFAKELMLAHQIPTAAAEVFTSHTEAKKYAESARLPLVVKADGLAAGKGVVVAQTRQEAFEALRHQMVDKLLGPAGERVLIEECLEGTEVSVFAFVQDEYVSPLVAACDYKRVGDGDQGPNTGGMGSFSPPRFWTAELEHRIRLEIMEPVAEALAKRGSPYCGVLYAGLMLTSQGPKVLEFNCRLGDPEAQVILPRLKTDLAEIVATTTRSRLGDVPGARPGTLPSPGRLCDISIQWEPSAYVGVVVTSGGYPGSYTTGYQIEGLDGLDGEVTVFHAGTKLYREKGDGEATVLTDGGRVLTLTAYGSTLEDARRRAYSNVGFIRFKDCFYRKDIASHIYGPAERPF